MVLWSLVDCSWIGFLPYPCTNMNSKEWIKDLIITTEALENNGRKWWASDIFSWWIPEWQKVLQAWLKRGSYKIQGPQAWVLGVGSTFSHIREECLGGCSPEANPEMSTPWFIKDLILGKSDKDGGTGQGRSQPDCHLRQSPSRSSLDERSWALVFLYLSVID